MVFSISFAVRCTGRPVLRNPRVSGVVISGVPSLCRASQGAVGCGVAPASCSASWLIKGSVSPVQTAGSPSRRGAEIGSGGSCCFLFPVSCFFARANCVLFVVGAIIRQVEHGVNRNFHKVEIVSYRSGNRKVLASGYMTDFDYRSRSLFMIYLLRGWFHLVNLFKRRKS
jgi:hypothetical protein